MESFLLDQAVFLEVENQLAVSSFPGDSQKLQQVLVNLIKNAVEASCEDSVVSLIFQQSKEYLIISVKDQGSGMSQEELSQIFQPFYTKKSAGTGLGLPICQRIIEAHEGILSAESKESFGSCFSIQLPLF